MTRLTEKDVHRWVFVSNMTPDVETLVRKWLVQRLDGFYCDLQDVYMPHIVLNNTPPLHAMARTAEVDARDVVKALMKATGLSPHLSVCGWPFCLADVDNINNVEGSVA